MIDGEMFLDTIHEFSLATAAQVAGIAYENVECRVNIANRICTGDDRIVICEIKLRGTRESGDAKTRGARFFQRHTPAMEYLRQFLLYRRAGRIQRQEFDAALKETYRIMSPGAIFRLVVPDLQSICQHYLETAKAGDPEACSVDRMISTAREGNGEIVVELESGTDVQKVLDEIKVEVDRIDTFPEEAEEPLVLEIINRDPTIYIAAYGDVAERNLRQAAEKIRDDLLDARIVSQMEIKSGADQGFFSAIKFKQPEVITQIELMGVRDMKLQLKCPKKICAVTGFPLTRWSMPFKWAVLICRGERSRPPRGRFWSDPKASFTSERNLKPFR